MLASDFPRSNYGDAVHVETNSPNKWVEFPDSKAKHFAMRLSSKLATLDNNKLHPLEFDGLEFFNTHKALLSLHPESSMVLVSERRNSFSNLIHHTYHQYVAGVRFFGGSFKVILSQDESGTSRVLSVHGMPLTEASLTTNYGDAASLRDAQGVSNQQIEFGSILSQYMISIQSQYIRPVNMDDFEFSHSPPELVWYLPSSSSPEKVDAVLSYFVRGIAKLNHEHKPFYAFVSFDTKEVVSFVQMNDDDFFSATHEKSFNEKSSVATSPSSSSPFSSPINDANIYCYDQFAKDFNDDEEDDYYSPDPDRYSNHTLIFDTTSGDYVYPTNDDELNLLVDNTLYVKYMYYSLSAGNYLTWRKNESDLNIEYNLSLANAYFDGVWGIHFGTGFITDDVVSHEWSHGYTQTGDDLVYRGQSGSMNEGFSDVFGESIDILNEDTPDTNIMRSSSPASCTSTMNSRHGKYGQKRGTDTGNRWSLGEEVSYYHWDNGDGSFRDMYYPECFFHPGAMYSPYYACTTYYDNGGVHLNSGVFNHLYSVLVDGGEYTKNGVVTTVSPLGLTKALNLFWRAHEELTPNSVFSDYAVILSEICRLSVGEILFHPNIYNSSILEADSLTAADCDVVDRAVNASGINSKEDVCPNIDCSGEPCIWKRCPAEQDNVEIYYEDYDYYMGDSRVNGSDGKIDPPCPNATSSYARVFDQESFYLDRFKLTCIQFGYIMLGQTNATLDIYIDVDGGEPNVDSLVHLKSQEFLTVNANMHMQVQTVTFDQPVLLPFNKSDQTLVVVLTTPFMEQGFMSGGGQVNDAVRQVEGVAVGQTYLSGDCLNDFKPSNSSTQWYIRLHGSNMYKYAGSSVGGMFAGEVMAIIVVVCFVVAAAMALTYFITTRKSLHKHAKLDEESSSKVEL